ncbi:rab3 GTPase-activating protein catalytic subunit-like isoform X1 [Maniola jurtina]|uniref:rab3 GTPase-activating protein catalytic subunit-like isoform X1 n=1 Tax=Maniola jurtina TaxID=191418 RepID=UPI001E68B599|nr:rab3 GTPase-activating protein catalytic subunit-like isoform X1 [Maniola jurtina]
MNEEIDEYDIYHQDFTTASEWEVLIARLEEIIVEWNLSKSKLTKTCPEYTKKWIAKSEDLKFRGLSFTMTYNALEPLKSQDGEREPEEQSLLTEIQQGLWDSTTNFMDNVDGSPFPVSNWFGLKRYLMLYPKAPLTDGSLIKLIMSSVHIAFSIIDCGIPFFVKIREHWQHTYLGIFEDNDYKVSFDVIHLKRISNQCSHLSGLVSLFKSKISSPVPLDAVVISTKFSYELKDSDSFTWRKRTHSNEFLSIDGFDVKKLIELPFGSENNPLHSALLNAIWPHFRESAIVDSSTFSDIDPIMAPTWTITLKLRSNINCLLSEIIRKMMNLLDNDSLLMDVLGLSRSLGLVNPLNKITEAPITISKLVKAAVGRNTHFSEFKGPISDDLLMPLLYYVFPDAVEDNTFPYPETLEVESKKDGAESKLCSYVKTSPEDGLVWRLSVTSARLMDAGGLPYLAHFWYEFTQELQYRWEHRILVPGVVDGAPNARSCLLHQKLQLLNCCIKRAQEGSGAAGYSSDEEFFDCSEDEGAEDQLPWDRPVGRLHRLDNITMKNGAPLYVPRTQDPAPKTEDQLEEDAELMVRLGDDAKASELRARMMSASLLSDMEAFKAANPGAELCDFVHWYSPRDWKPDEGGSLGDRMLLPGNPWVEAWNVARPVPSARQRRLFDETREAEQVLHFLRSRTIGGVAELLLPAILRAGAIKAIAEGAPATNSTIGGVDKRRTFEVAARELLEAEREACRSICVRKVLGNSAEGKPLDVAGRSRVLNAMGGALPAPALREFTLRVKDEVGPQVMRAALSNEMTIIGAFTERIVCL